MSDHPRLKKLFVVFLFVTLGVGLIILSSAGVVDSQRRFDTPYYYISHQLLYGLLPGIFVFFVFSKIPYKYWKKLSLPILIVAITLLVMIFLPSFGINIKGAHRWILLGPLQFQPSEFLKFALVVYLAAWFSSRERTVHDATYALLPLILVIAFISGLLISQPDLGTLGIVVVIAVGMYFFAGARLKYFMILALCMVITLSVFAVAAPYRFNRLKAFFNPSEHTQNISYHINQAQISIGSGGLLGVGFGQSRAKQYFLPEPVGDSIFAIAVEETGFIGAVVIIGLYLSLLLIMFSMARNAPDFFGQLLVSGAAIWFGTQVFVNIASISGLIPLTGVPLPLMSYGSSALVSLMGMFGIVFNVTKT